MWCNLMLLDAAVMDRIAVPTWKSVLGAQRWGDYSLEPRQSYG